MWASGGGEVAICQCLVSEPAVDSIRLFGCHPAVLATLNCSIRFALTFVRIFTCASFHGPVFPNLNDLTFGQETEERVFKIE